MPQARIKFDSRSSLDPKGRATMVKLTQCDSFVGPLRRFLFHSILEMSFSASSPLKVTCLHGDCEVKGDPICWPSKLGPRAFYILIHVSYHPHDHQSRANS